MFAMFIVLVSLLFLESAVLITAPKFVKSALDQTSPEYLRAAGFIEFALVITSLIMLFR